MTKSFKITTGILALSLLLISRAQATKPESKWHRVGKTAHAKVRNKSLKTRNSYCAATCRKAGARKASDAGACKEGCVFG